VGVLHEKVAREHCSFCFVSGSAQADKKAAKTYRCAANDAVDLLDNGRLGKDGVAEFKRKRLDGVIIDTLTGAITYASGSREIWDVVQEGSSINDHVLIPSSLFPTDIKETAARAATDLIRIREWDEKPQVTFMAFELSTLVTGTCDIVR